MKLTIIISTLFLLYWYFDKGCYVLACSMTLVITCEFPLRWFVLLVGLHTFRRRLHNVNVYALRVQQIQYEKLLWLRVSPVLYSYVYSAAQFAENGVVQGPVKFFWSSYSSLTYMNLQTIAVYFVTSSISNRWTEIGHILCKNTFDNCLHLSIWGFVLFNDTWSQ